MDFVTVVDQAIALLRQRGRLTSRTLQLQFQLDEVHLEALKNELIDGQRVAVEEDGRVLVWTRDERLGVSPGVVDSALMRLYGDLVSAPCNARGASRIARSRSSLALRPRASRTCGRTSSSNSWRAISRARG